MRSINPIPPNLAVINVSTIGQLMPKECSHTWYMRQDGITCTKCLIIWDKSMETDSESLDS